MTSNIVIRGDILYTNMGEGIGSEQGGIRPVVCIQNNVGNKFSPTVIIAPITSQCKTKLPTHVEINEEGNTGLGKQSIVLLEQIKTLDKRRLLQKIGSCSQKTINNIDKALLISLGIEVNKTNVIDNVNTYNNNRIEKFDINRANNIGTSINKLENFINTHYNEVLIDIEDSIKMHLYELQNYCNKFQVDYRFYYKPVKRKNYLMASERIG